MCLCASDVGTIIVFHSIGSKRKICILEEIALFKVRNAFFKINLSQASIQSRHIKQHIHGSLISVTQFISCYDARTLFVAANFCLKLSLLSLSSSVADHLICFVIKQLIF